MKIETQNDWNMVLAGCGCCEMPVCPVPTKECQSVQVAFACYYILPNVTAVTAGERDCRRFAKYRTTYNYQNIQTDNPSPGDSYSRTENTITTFEADYSTSPCGFYGESVAATVSEVIDRPSTSTDTTYTSSSESIRGGACTGSWTFTDAITPANNDSGTNVTCTPIDFPVMNDYTRTGDSFQLVDIVAPDNEITITTTTEFLDEMDPDWAIAFLEQFTLPSDANGESCEAQIWALEGCGDTVVAAKKSAFRWIIPDTFEGSYFKITWDILTEPDGWDAETPTVFRSLAAGGTWEWTGPGDPEDAASWKSGWYVITPPTTPGTKRVVNIRFECYRSTKFGSKPQVTGEAVELPDP